MKKISTLFMGLIIALSAVADSNARVLFGKPAPKHQIQRVRMVTNAPQAKLEATEVTVGYCGSTFYAEDNDVFYMLYNEDYSVAFTFDIVCAEGEQDVVSGQTYTLNDMLADYCMYGTPLYVQYGYGTAYASASFTKTVAEDQSFTIEATVADADGNEYHLHYAQGAPQITEEELTLEGVANFVSDYTQIIAAPADSSIVLSIVLNGHDVEGTFAAEDFYAYYTFITKYGEDTTYYTLKDSADVQIVKNEETGICALTDIMLLINDEDPTDIIKYTLNITFAAPVKKVSENVITLTYDAATRSVNIATTNDDPYFFYIEAQSDYDEYESDFTQESLIEEIDAWIYTMQQYQALSYYTLTGNMTVDCVDFFGSYAATDDYVALAAPMENAEINGTAVYLQFHFDFPEAVENTNAAVKAEKVLRNGQLIIIKNGVEYNALGTIVK